MFTPLQDETFVALLPDSHSFSRPGSLRIGPLQLVAKTKRAAVNADKLLLRRVENVQRLSMSANGGHENAEHGPELGTGPVGTLDG
jgi:hypothetical protein